MQHEILKTYLGYEIVSPLNEHLGDLWNFAIDECTGELAYAIFRSGDKCYAFLWDEFHLSEENVLELMMTAQLLRELPGLEPYECPDWRGHRVRLLYEPSLN
jgi:hypothetical protein